MSGNSKLIKEIKNNGGENMALLIQLQLPLHLENNFKTTITFVGKFYPVPRYLYKTNELFTLE